MEQVQGLLILVLPPVGGWIGARIFGATHKKAVAASILSTIGAFGLAFVLGPAATSSFIAFAMAGVVIGLILRLKSAEIGGLTLGLLAASYIALASGFYLPAIVNIGEAQIYQNCTLFKDGIIELSEQEHNKNRDLYIIKIDNEEEIAKNNPGVICSAQAVFSNSEKSGIIYQSYKKHDIWWIEYTPDQ